jgi:transcriptional regulator with XRE-family HTH domain
VKAKNDSGTRLALKLAIISAGFTHRELAERANENLAGAQRLSENGLTKIVTNRRAPTADQATALARLLGRSTIELFPGGVG